MKVVDINVLIYAVDEQSPKHERIRHWWNEALSSDEAIGLSWLTIIAFLRIATNPVTP